LFERYTEKARRAIFFALHEARAVGSPYIEPEHLMLALMRENRKLLITAFGTEAGVASFDTKLRSCLRPLAATPGSVDLPLANTSKRILAFAAEEAERMQHRHIGPEHLLLGIMREKGTPTADLLEEFNVSPEPLRGAFEPMTDPYFDRVRSRSTQDRLDPKEGMLEFAHEQGGQTLATARLAAVWAIPGKGEEIVLQDSAGEWLQFRVTDVRHVFKNCPEGVTSAMQVLSKVIVYLSPVDKKPIRIPDVT
jgi:ATP-dependent Clp protease ATP-binding subunit ClpA